MESQLISTKSKSFQSSNAFNLTPVEEHAGILFKRDDYYKPFDDFEITGGKVRQCYYLLQQHYIGITEALDNTVATAASVHSPQAVIVARVAKELGMKCIIGHGAKNPLKHRAMQMCEELGAELVTLCTSNAYNTVLYGKLAELNKTRKFFTVNFGYEASVNREAIIDLNANQVKNLPNDLDGLFINVGSGISSAGILAGVEKYKPYLFEKQAIHLIQPFGYDRQDVIRKHANLDFGHDFHYHKGDYDYHTPYHVDVDSELHLDEIYEGKAFGYMWDNLINYDDVQMGKKYCFWIIGDSNVLRKPLNK